MSRMSVQDYKGVFVFIQQVDNKISGVSFELLGKANELAEGLGYRGYGCSAGL